MKLLGIDYGNKRIGLAIGESDGKIAVPYGMIENKGDNFVLCEIKELCNEEGIDKIIIGIPQHKEFESKQYKIIEKFIIYLKNNIEIKIDSADEAFTSKIAEKDEKYKNLYKDRKKGWKDAVAASEILRDYMELNK